LRAAWRADRDLYRVVLGDLRGVVRQPVGAGDHDRRHPVGPPYLRCPAEREQYLVHRARQMAERHLLAEHCAEPSGVRQRADQHERRLAPRRDMKLEPVPLDLLARGVINLDRHRRAATLRADQARGPQP
jgi:hypothetical protein